MARGPGAWLLVVVVATLWAPSAAGAAEQGACTDRSGITVVVDFTDLGGGVVVRCAGALPAHADGFTALQAAGFQVTQPLRTPGFVCRIDAQPAPSAEACVDTPPTSAYWSYWTADRGGSWRYSSLGAAARTVEPGGVEGWAFAQDRASSAVPAPRTSPPPVPTTVPAPSAGGASGGASGGTPPTASPAITPPPGRTGVAGVTTTRPPAAAAGPTPTTPTGAPTASTTAVEPSTNPSTTTERGAPTTSSVHPTQRVEVAAAGSGEPDGGGGSGAATAAAVVAVAALGAGAITTARRRAARAATDDDH